MSKESKQTELKLLHSIIHPSDQELSRIEELEEDLKIINQLEQLNITDKMINEKPKQELKLQPIEKQNRTLFEYIIDYFRKRKGLPPKDRPIKQGVLGKIMTRIYRHYKPLPATYDEIQQLKLNAKRASLKKSIAEDEAEIKRLKPSLIRSILGTNDNISTKKRSKGKNSNDDSDDLRDLIGRNDKEKYKGLT